jgi:hypothetical protein
MESSANSSAQLTPDKLPLPSPDQNEDAAKRITDNPTQSLDEYEDAEKNYKPKTLRFWTLMIGIYLSTFLVMLDRTIIATAVPKITDEFNSIEDIGWYGSAYMLAAACFSPISGRIYQLYSTKWVFIISLVIFEAGSAVCGAAPSSVTLIVGRAIAGLGSASVFVGGMTAILPIIPLRSRSSNHFKIPLFPAYLGSIYIRNKSPKVISNKAITNFSLNRTSYF